MRRWSAAQKLMAVYLFDETEILRYRQEITDEQMVAGLIYLDNYDEALESVEEVRRSLLTALIDRKINKYIGSMDGVVKKLEKGQVFLYHQAEVYGTAAGGALLHSGGGKGG